MSVSKLNRKLGLFFLSVGFLVPAFNAVVYVRETKQREEQAGQRSELEAASKKAAGALGEKWAGAERAQAEPRAKAVKEFIDTMTSQADPAKGSRFLKSLNMPCSSVMQTLGAPDEQQQSGPREVAGINIGTETVMTYIVPHNGSALFVCAEYTNEPITVLRSISFGDESIEYGQWSRHQLR
jgi:hypothetical protein